MKDNARMLEVPNKAQSHIEVNRRSLYVMTSVGQTKPRADQEDSY